MSDDALNDHKERLKNDDYRDGYERGYDAGVTDRDDFRDDQHYHEGLLNVDRLPELPTSAFNASGEELSRYLEDLAEKLAPAETRVGGDVRTEGEALREIARRLRA